MNGCPNKNMNATQTSQFNTILICRSSSGEPTFFCCAVTCTEEQHDNGDHLDMVCEAAESVGLTVPGFGEEGNMPIMCDAETDFLGKALDYSADWEAAQKLDLAEYLAKGDEVPA